MQHRHEHLVKTTDRCLLHGVCSPSPLLPTPSACLCSPGVIGPPDALLSSSQLCSPRG